MEDFEEKYVPWKFHTCKLCPYRSNSAFVMCKHESHHEQCDFETFFCDSKLPEMYRCDFCKFETDIKVNLAKHFKVFHQGKHNNLLEKTVELYICENCDFQTYSLLVFTRHVHINCDSIFGTDLELQLDHDKWCEYKWGGFTWYRCKYCFYETLHEQIIQSHVETHERVVQKPTEKLECYICRDCKFQTFSLLEITKHYHNCNFQKVVHVAINDDKWYKCQSGDITWLKCKLCPFKTEKRYIIRKHIFRSHGNLKAVKWFKCDHCSHKTDDHSALKQHVQAKHTSPENINWFRCERCLYKCKGADVIKKHVLMNHTDADKLVWFKCEHCSFKTRAKDYLQIHIRKKHTNLGDVRFKCEHCRIIFKYKISLKKHVRTKHDIVGDHS